MTRPALTWLALWLAIATAVAAGIIAGFLFLRLTDYCGCLGTRLIDLTASDFAGLAPLSQGLIQVEVIP